MEQVKAVISKYYGVLRSAVEGRDWHFDELPFDEGISVIGPNERFDGKEAIQAMYPQFLSVVKDFVLKEQFFGEKSACVIIEFFPANGAPPVLTAEWFHIRNGKIVTLTPIYDTSAWTKVIS